MRGHFKQAITQKDKFGPKHLCSWTSILAQHWDIKSGPKKHKKLDFTCNLCKLLNFRRHLLCTMLFDLILFNEILVKKNFVTLTMGYTLLVILLSLHHPINLRLFLFVRHCFNYELFCCK